MLKSNFRWIAIRAALALLMIFLLQACGNNHSTEQKNVSVTQIPTAVQKLILPNGTLTAWVTVDGGSRTQMTIDSTAGTASATISGLTLATHTVLIEYEFTDTYGTILVASASKPVDLSSGSGSLNFSDADYNTSYDSDGDGITNVVELGAGTNPFGHPPISSSCFPLAVDLSFSDIAFDYDGNLLLPEYSSNTIRVMNPVSCAVTTMATISGQSLITVVEDKLRNRVYSGSSSGEIYEINPDTGSSTLLVDLGTTYVNSLVRAPVGYGSYGRQLIAATSAGDIVAIDQSQVSPTPVVIANIGGVASDIEFGADGTLYVAAYNANKIMTLTADGTLADFAINISSPDGLEVDNARSRLLIAASGGTTATLYAAAIPSGTLTALRKASFGGGFGTSGLALDSSGTLLMHLASSQIVAQNVSLPAFSTSCLPLGGLSGNYGQIAFRANGDLLIADLNNNTILSLDRTACTTTTLATITGEPLRAVVEDPARDRIYAGSNTGNIYEVNPNTGASTLLVSAGLYVNALVKAPASFGSYGGQLIIATSDGTIYAVDQTATSPSLQTVAVNPNGAVSDLAFGSDGTLYAADYYGAKIVTVAANGTLADFATGLSGPDGLAIDNAGTQLLIADSATDTLNSAQIPSGTVSTLGMVNFDASWAPSGLAFDGYATVLMHTATAAIDAFGLYPAGYFGASTQLPNTGSISPNYLLGHAITVNQRISVTSLGNYYVTADSNAKFALYSDDAGRPGTLLVSTASFATTAGRNEIDVNATIIGPGNYWLMGVYDTLQSIYSDTSGSENIHYISLPFANAIPSTWPVSDTQYTGNTFNYFLGGGALAP